MKYLLVVGSLALAAAACGDDDDGGDASPPPTEESAEPTEPAETAETETATATAPEETATTGDGSGDGTTSTAPLPPPPTPEDTAEWDAIVEAANEEGSLVLYTSTLADPVVAAFESAYPDIDVEIVRLPSADLPPKIDAEVESGNVVGDALWITAISWEHDKADAGTHFAEINGPSVALYPEGFLYGGAVAPISGDVYGVMYNTDQVDEPAEKTWTALVDEQYAGRVSVLEPSGPAQSSYLNWLSEREDGTYFQLLADVVQPVITASSAPNAQAIGAGENAWSPMVLAGFYQQMVTENAPVAWYAPDGEAYSITYDAMVMKDAPNVNAARVFVDFMMSQEGQQAIINGGHLLSWLGVTNPDVTIDGAITRDLSDISYPQPGEDHVDAMLALYDELFR